MKYHALHHTAVRNSGSKQVWAVDRYHRDKCWACNRVVPRNNKRLEAEHELKYGHKLSRVNKSSLGWYITYNYFIDTDAKRYYTREIGTETAAIRGHNCNIPSKCDTVHTCVAGDFNFQLYLEKDQEEVFLDINNELRQKYPKIIIKGHRSLQKNRTCPGKFVTLGDFQDWNKKNSPEDIDKAVDIKKIQAQIKILQLRVMIMNLLIKLKLMKSK